MKKVFLKLKNYLQTDLSYLLKGGFWVFLSNGIQISLGVLVTIALANVLPKETLGTYQYIMSIAGILSVLTLSGLGTAVTRAVAQGDDGVLRSGVRIKFKWSITIIVASGAMSLYYFLNDNSTLGYALLIIGAFAPFIESFKLYENYLYGKEAFKDSVLLGAWRKPLPIIVLLTTIYLTNDVLLIVLAYFVSNAAAYALVYRAIVKKYRPPISNNATLVGVAKHQSVLRFIAIAGSHLDKIILWTTLGSVAVAVFTVAQLATKYTGVFLNTITALVLPRVAKRDLETLKQTLPRKARIMTAAMALGTATYILVAPLLFRILFPEYPESVAISQALAFSFILMTASIYGQVFIAHNQIKTQYFLSITTSVIKIFLLLILISKYSIWGAVYAILLSDAIGFVLNYLMFRRAKRS